MKTRTKAGIIACIIYLAITIFSQWGFNPKSWEVADRLFWAILLISVVGFTISCPLFDD